MLMEIGGKENVPNFVEQVKAKKRVLSGFGHRVSISPTQLLRTLTEAACMRYRSTATSIHARLSFVKSQKTSSASRGETRFSILLWR
jgi:Citrate synthase, C-terminal domain